MGSTMMEEVQQPLEEEPGDGLQLAIATTFSVAQTGEFLIKQEPQELIAEVIAPEVMDQNDSGDLFGDDAIDNPPQIYPRVSHAIMHRAVSPPSFADSDEQKIEKLMLYYKDKFRLKDVTVELESCDKIWETLQLIKNIQNSSCEEDDDSIQITSPKTITNQPKLPGPLIPYQPILGNNNKALPDFRFSIKSKKKLYHCITCGKEFIDSQHLQQHAIEEHGIYFNPKRIYKAKTEIVPKSSPVISTMNKNKIIEEMESENCVLATQVIQPVKLSESIQQLPEIKSGLSNNNAQTEEMETKSDNAKEKIKCILCKRVCTDIIYHMKGYHKVGCISSIIAQCERITVDNNISTDTIVIEKSNEMSEESLVDINETLAVAVEKRKRNTPRWTIQKKKRLSTDTVVKNYSKAPIKCNVCLGFYKSMKSFGHHRRLHQIRGETAENFDPARCRFLNSPLRTGKISSLSKEVITNCIPEQKENIEIQTVPVNHTAVQEDTKFEKQNVENLESDISEDLHMEINSSESEKTSCECGRSFRNYHTLYLHKVKCKKPDSKNSDKLHSQNSNDADSGISISIKIKKNKNDSYEVVPSNATIEDFRNSKDSDASSNDSGMVSVDYNNQKVDPVELSKYSKRHSILKIQVAENDEEVDIEDGDSDNSNLNYNNITVTSNHNEMKISTLSKENNLIDQNLIQPVKTIIKKSNAIPSLANFCRQALSKLKLEQMSTFKCQTCSAYFQNKINLMEHASKMKHDIKSLCPCGKKFKNLKYFNIHVRRYHPLLLKCSYCITNFDRIEKYNEHKCEINEGKPFIEPIIQTKCIQCKVLVDLGEQFDKHIKTHNNDGTIFYQCFKCELKFDNPHQRRLHFSKEHGFSSCQICGKLLHIDSISKHEAYHDGLGHPCHLCKKAFSQKTLLKKHIQCAHDPLINEIVKCIVCSKNMKLRYLKKHMSLHLHTEICRKCNKCYRSDKQNKLEDHIASNHPNEFPALKCDVCNVSFISDKRYKENSQEGTCKFDVNEITTFAKI